MLPHLTHLTSVTQNCTSFLNLRLKASVNQTVFRERDFLGISQPISIYSRIKVEFTKRQLSGNEFSYGYDGFGSWIQPVDATD